MKSINSKQNSHVYFFNGNKFLFFSKFYPFLKKKKQKKEEKSIKIFSNQFIDKLQPLIFPKKNLCVLF